ncbi:MAG: hypothetical protein JWM95_1290 [Gemmatimonadetes bacterium]|nr:hypothetical protein [Gemmatimonadota bacterium]
MPGGWFDSLVRRMGLPRAESRVIAGIPVDVINTQADVETREVFARAERILHRIHTYQPARYAHLRRDVLRIVVERFPCRGAYFSDRRAVLLELTFMVNAQFSDSQVAACLIHEAMHARLDRLSETFGIRSFDVERARHERICRRAELDFGQAVPDGAPVIQRATDSLAMADDEVAPSIDWDEANRRLH